MSTYSVVLYIHLLALLVGIGAAGVMAACLLRLRAALTLADAAPWGELAGKVERLFPIAIVGLFGSGAYLTSDVWTWSTHWIDVSIAALVVLSLQGPLVAGRAARRLEHALRENGPGALGEETRRIARHPGLWLTELTNVGLVLGIIWNMSQKPGLAGAIAAVVVAYAVGAAAAFAIARAPAERTAPVIDPAA